jgi:hypothetical protein
MIDLWITQAVHLSAGQAGLLLSLSVTLIGLVVLYHRQESE